MLLATALFAAPVPAASLDGVRRNCAKGQVGPQTCQCMITQLLRTRDGRITLDAVGTATNDPSARSIAAMDRRQGVDPAGAQRAIQASRSDQVVAECEKTTRGR